METLEKTTHMRHNHGSEAKDRIAVLIITHKEQQWVLLLLFC